MAYVVVVFAIINSAFLVAGAIGFYYLHQDILTSVGTVIQEEVRRQDDRIEKRTEKARGRAEETVPVAMDGQPTGGPRVGQPYRR